MDASGVPENLERKTMNVSVSIPEELYRKAAEVARAQQIPVDEVFASAVADHLSAWDRLQEKAARGDREKFQRTLDKVPDIEPDESDRY
jgi:hypothetical protein